MHAWCREDHPLSNLYFIIKYYIILLICHMKRFGMKIDEDDRGFLFQAFDLAVGSRFPENRILSHDLIEGCHARCGFLNDVELLEDHPSRYLADASRRQLLDRLRRKNGQTLSELCEGHNMSRQAVTKHLARPAPQPA